ncbi:glycosyltransferase [Paraburkholderia sp. BCC1884]|uniref:glycosyltransferase n=1 Tax=Paraburkholderia sp. BCC1884 TaxID=2562668 RepID=UPI0011825569|nr:glycosyltransferase [Paraburkholderia sp. BCC1884]
MKILIVTNMYAGHNSAQPSQGVFVTEQVEALRVIYGDAIDVLVIEAFRGRLAYLKSLVQVVRLGRHKAYDVVHYHFGLSACSAPLVRLFSNAKVVVTFHGSDVMGRSWMRAISLAAARFSHACIGVSDEISAKVSRGSRRCVTIPCAVNESLFVEPGNEYMKKMGRKVVVFPSSPTRPEKDYPLFKSVIARLSDTSGFEMEERHIDGLDREAVRDLLLQADCLVMTSEREGSPQSVKEAMAVNLPVVSVDVGDVRQLLQGVSHSAVVEGRDAAALAFAAADVLTRAARSNGRTRLKSLGYFSTEVAQQISRLYESLTHNKRRHETH